MPRNEEAVELIKVMAYRFPPVMLHPTMFERIFGKPLSEVKKEIEEYCEQRRKEDEAAGIVFTKEEDLGPAPTYSSECAALNNIPTKEKKDD